VRSLLSADGATSVLLSTASLDGDAEADVDAAAAAAAGGEGVEETMTLSEVG
jgi:hypothetical protein